MKNVIDYTTYTDSELREVLEKIEQDAAPENYARLTAEIERRKSVGGMVEPEPVLDTDAIKSMLPLVGWAQLIGSAALFALLIWSFLSGSSSSMLGATLTVLLVGLGAVAGILTLKRRGIGYILSAVNYALQAPSFLIGSVLYNYVGFAGIWVGVNSFGAFSFSLHIKPGFQFALLNQAPGWFAGVDLFAAAMLGVSIAALQLGENAS